MSRVSSPNMQGKASVHNAEVKDCFPECCVSPITSFPVCKNASCNSWLMFRWRTRMLVEHRYFEWFILFTVLVSSLVLVRFTFYPKSHFRYGTDFESLMFSTRIEQSAFKPWSVTLRCAPRPTRASWSIQIATNVRRQSPKFECHLSSTRNGRRAKCVW